MDQDYDFRSYIIVEPKLEQRLVNPYMNNAHLNKRVSSWREPKDHQSSKATVPRAFDVAEGRSQMRFEEAAYPEPVPVPADPPSLVVDPSSPAPEAALPSTPIIISDDPTVRTPEWIPTPPATPELQFSYEEGGRITTPPGRQCYIWMMRSRIEMNDRIWLPILIIIIIISFWVYFNYYVCIV